MTLITRENATARQAGDTNIMNYITKELSPDLSLAVVTLSGVHPSSVSQRCERIYYIVRGSGRVRLDGIAYDVKATDAVYIARGREHSVEGNLEYVVVNTPAFDSTLEGKN